MTYLAETAFDWHEKQVTKMSPYCLKSDLVAFVICSGNKIDNGKKENLRIKFSIPFLFFWIDKVLWLEGRIKFW